MFIREIERGDKVDKLLDIAIELATIWATMSVIDGIPSILEAPTTDIRINKECLVEWAQEYNSLEHMDKYDFLKMKILEGNQ